MYALHQRWRHQRYCHTNIGKDGTRDERAQQNHYQDKLDDRSFQAKDSLNCCAANTLREAWANKFDNREAKGGTNPGAHWVHKGGDTENATKKGLTGSGMRSRSHIVGELMKRSRYARLASNDVWKVRHRELRIFFLRRISSPGHVLLPVVIVLGSMSTTGHILQKIWTEDRISKDGYHKFVTLPSIKTNTQ